MPLIKGKSKKAFEHNMKAEMHAGKPKDQALAIAYSVQRRNKKKMYDGGEVLDADSSGKAGMDMIKGKKLSHADEIDARKEHMVSEDERDEREMDMLDSHPVEHEEELDARKESMSDSDIDHAKDERELEMLDGHEHEHSSEKRAASRMALADDEDEMEVDMLHKEPDESDLPSSIAEAIRAKKKMMAKGGEVDLQDNADEHLNEEDELSYEAARKKTYFDDSQIDAQPEDSNEHADELMDEDEHGMDMISKIRSKMKSKKMI